MKSKIFMYLFFFSILLLLFMFMNQKSIYEKQQKQIDRLTEKVKESTDSIAAMEDRILDLNYFTLQGNENPVSYLENIGLDAAEVENTLTEDIYDLNLTKGGNPLINVEGYGELRINKVKFLNHRWIQVDFTDGSLWGEMLIDYFYDENMQVELTPISTVLYPN